MILLYIIKQGGSTWDDNELRYSLRSVEKYGRNVEKVVICGHRPAWVQNVVHSTVPDPYALRYDNTWHKMKTMCHNLQQPFCLMNDDFFLLKETDFDTLPDYYDGDINSLAARYRRISNYVSMLFQTKYILQKNNRPLRNYAVHFPMIIDPVKMRPFFEHFGEEPGVSFRVMYGNLCATNNVEKPDLKISEELSTAEIEKRLAGQDMFSIGDNFLTNDGKAYLQHLFPHKSKFEK